MSKEAMKLALEALEISPMSRKNKDAIDTLREALAEQPAQQALDRMAENARELGLDYELAQQEPVAWVCYGAPGKRDIDFEEADINRLPIGTQLYTSPPAQRTWVSLTDEEIYSVLENLQVMHHRPPTTDSRVIFALAVEAKLKEKNT